MRLVWVVVLTCTVLIPSLADAQSPSTFPEPDEDLEKTMVSLVDTWFASNSESLNKCLELFRQKNVNATFIKELAHSAAYYYGGTDNRQNAGKPFGSNRYGPLFGRPDDLRDQKTGTVAQQCVAEDKTLQVVAYTFAGPHWAIVLCPSFFDSDPPGTDSGSRPATTEPDDDVTRNNKRMGTVLHETMHQYFLKPTHPDIREALEIDAPDPSLGPNYSGDISEFFQRGCQNIRR